MTKCKFLVLSDFLAGLFCFWNAKLPAHPDTARLLLLLQRLVDAGTSVIVVEHNLDLVKAADWVIDLDPEGGVAGGQLLAEGRPEDVAQVKESYTGQGLKEML